MGLTKLLVGSFSNWGPSFDEGGPAGWGNQSAIDENGTLAHPYSTASSATGIPAAFPEFADARYEWRPYNSVENFFRTGTVINTSVNARGSSDDGKYSYNVNYGNLSDEGFTPGNKVIRNTFSMGGRAVLSNNFTLSGTVNYSKTSFKTLHLLQVLVMVHLVVALLSLVMCSLHQGVSI